MVGTVLHVALQQKTTQTEGRYTKFDACRLPFFEDLTDKVACLVHPLTCCESNLSVTCNCKTQLSYTCIAHMEADIFCKSYQPIAHGP